MGFISDKINEFKERNRPVEEKAKYKIGNIFVSPIFETELVNLNGKSMVKFHMKHKCGLFYKINNDVFQHIITGGYYRPEDVITAGEYCIGEMPDFFKSMFGDFMKQYKLSNSTRISLDLVEMLEKMVNKSIEDVEFKDEYIKFQ